MKVRTYVNIVIALSEAQLIFTYACSGSCMQPWVKTLLIGLMLFGIILAVVNNIALKE